MKIFRLVTVAAFLCTHALAIGAQHAMPPGMTHEEHLAQLAKASELKKRGDAAMGFDQDQVVHHFLLTRDGGVIQVEATSPDDAATRDAVRAHLRTIASAFKNGDFDAPFATHAEMPPRVTTMRALKSTIAYTFEDLPAGGHVRIATTHAKALKAVHEFLRYQIREHQTGDRTTFR